MESARYLSCLQSDYRRMREVVQGHYQAPVPTCPDWTVADLVRHVGQVYLHKVALMRHGKEPEPWPPADFTETDPVRLLDRGYTALAAEFTARKPEDPATTWYGPDQTVGFWLRRMALETVIHRIDAELAGGALVAPVDDDLAVDGIDELFEIFLAWSFTQWPEDFTGALANSPGRTCVVQVDGTSGHPAVPWVIQTGPGRLTVQGGPGAAGAAGAAQGLTPDVTVSGTPAAVFRWSWGREAGTAPGQVSSVAVNGQAEAVAELRRCLAAGTQ